MLIADLTPDGRIEVVRDEHVIARLGKGVDEQRKILPETFDRVLSYLSGYVRIHEQEHSDRLVACGTSALRDAANSKDFVDFIRDRLGFEVSILSGDEEAELTFFGGISEFVERGLGNDYVVIDIGGGSTELVAGTRTSVRSKISLDIGSVRITERFLKTSPPRPKDLEAAREFADGHIRSIAQISQDTLCIGVAGTLTTLASIDLQLSAYDRIRVSGHILTLDVIGSIFNRLKEKTLAELHAIPQILPQRADIILAGILILMRIMEQIGVQKIAVSDRGLRYGMVLREAQTLHGQ